MSVWGLVSDGEFLFLSSLSFFFFFYANMSKLSMLAAVTDKVEGDAQSKCGCRESGALREREKETQLKWERKRGESFIEILIW